jgi:FkbM family methyltransferase
MLFIMRFHVLGLPHTVSSKDFNACAYTQKVVKFCKMMSARGHYIIHYGHEDSDAICNEHVSVITNEDWQIAYGNYDWRKNFFKFEVEDHAYKTFYKNAIEEVGKRKQPLDFILPFWGSGVRPICDAHSDLICVEPGIGYAEGHWARWKIFESYAIYHAYCGIQNVGTCRQDWYEVVIPNYFDLEDFDYSEEKDDYFLFLGRVYSGKGIEIAIQMTEKIGAKLIVAGQNPDNMTFPNHVEYIGYADVETRRRLLSRAKGLIIGSMYIEPFGGVQVEALLSGTPTITTDWGAFTENNIQGLTGYRCRTFEDFVNAGKNIDNIKPSDCRKFAEKFSLENVALMYEKYFQDVLNVYTNEGWYHIENDFKVGKYDKFFDRLDSEDIFFTVVGAMDGVNHDNTFKYAFKNKHWKGLLIEPMKDYFEKLKENYEHRENLIFENVAISDSEGYEYMFRIPSELVESGEVPSWSDGISTFYPEKNVMREDHLISKAVKEPVLCTTFENISNKHSIEKIDVLQIDVEGCDSNVFWQIWNLNYRPKLIIIEIVNMQSKEKNKIEKTLKNNSYTLSYVGDDLIATKEN